MLCEKFVGVLVLVLAKFETYGNETNKKGTRVGAYIYSTVTDFARFLGLSTSSPFSFAT